MGHWGIDICIFILLKFTGQIRIVTVLLECIKMYDGKEEQIPGFYFNICCENIGNS